MKKMFVFLFVAVLCLSFAGCRSNMEVGPTGTNAPETRPVTTPPATTIPATYDNVPNIPDPSVDNGTLEDLIPGDGARTVK